MNPDPGCAACTLYEITRLSDPLLCDWLDLYETAFHPEERGRVSWHIRGLQAREAGELVSSRLWTLLDAGGGLMGMAQTAWIERHSMAYLGYFAILPELRGQGSGTTFYNQLVVRMQEPGPDFVLFDVALPDRLSGPAREEAERRIRFYQRMGAELLPGVNFYWHTLEQRMMFQRFGSLEVEEILRRAGALAREIGGELRARPD
jgi:GNAT superfamily N-acetyltransferase